VWLTTPSRSSVFIHAVKRGTRGRTLWFNVTRFARRLARAPRDWRVEYHARKRTPASPARPAATRNTTPGHLSTWRCRTALLATYTFTARAAFPTQPPPHRLHAHTPGAGNFTAAHYKRWLAMPSPPSRTRPPERRKWRLVEPAGCGTFRHSAGFGMLLPHLSHTVAMTPYSAPPARFRHHIHC